MIAIGLVLLSGFFHALWNVLAKRSRSKIAFLLSIQCLSFVFFLPFIFNELVHLVWTWPVVWVFVGSSVLHGVYFLLMSRAYSVGDVSQIYPIARGSAVLVAPIGAVFFLGEVLSKFQWLGVLLVVFGVISLGNIRWKTAIHGRVQLALLMGACISLYILVDKVGLSMASPLLVNWIGTAGNIVLLLFFLPRKRAFIREWSRNAWIILAGCILAPLSYLLFLWAAQMAQVAQLAPIREIGTVFGVAVGVFLLHEQGGKARILSSVMVVVGIILIGLG